MSRTDGLVTSLSDRAQTLLEMLRVDWAGNSVWARASVYSTWFAVLLVSVLSLFRLLRDLPGALEALEPPQTFIESLIMYPIGGRLLVLVLFIALVVMFGLRRQSWFLVGGALFNVAWLLDVDRWAIEFLESFDPVAAARTADDAVNPSFLIFLTWFALIGFIAALVFTGLIRAFGGWFARSARKRRISELFLWVVLLTPALLYSIAWVAFQLSGEVFTDLGVYPVLGRLVGWVGLLVVGTLAISSRPLLLSLGLLSYAIQLFDVDPLLVEMSEARDEFFQELNAFGPALDSFFLVQSWLSFFLPVLLLWTLVISIAGVVRRRTRARLEGWIDSRRTAIYGAEDVEEDAPRRVSALAVLSLVFAFLVPVLGLVLAYAARNDFVAARPKKSGLDLAVAGTIIGWFGLGFQLFIVILTIVSSFLGGGGPFEILLLGMGTFFGLDVLDPFSAVFDDVFGGLGINES